MPSGDCTAAQTDCREAPHGDGDEWQAEIDAVGLDFVTFHSRNLAVPARRDLDGPRLLRGKEVFYETGCTSCHAPKHVTARLEDQPEQNFQPIWPYSDLFLHDMGEGLADSRPEVCADGREWRTAPLWDIGLTKLASGHTQFHHDGRARSLLEAALPHGGEAEAARGTGSWRCPGRTVTRSSWASSGAPTSAGWRTMPGGYLATDGSAGSSAPRPMDWCP